ncbi:hypothetical protein VFPPC_18007 [Pochonia chlamydosporia 170]|uniref:Uncharacterized protein n=1 Tax=Pochonia chlamydosporia 170 TaxID=1380566 RepID=A0A219AQ94_METCM|nr:hypothetical protein VFPPC_18007 [Pochonia chlamydosporia 170]OWT42752.1 hypothetical protein VFPPC_18007 [Pochonia chlamydosporia 170]
MMHVNERQGRLQARLQCHMAQKSGRKYLAWCYKGQTHASTCHDMLCELGIPGPGCGYVSSKNEWRLFVTALDLEHQRCPWKIVPGGISLFTILWHAIHPSALL